MYTITDRKNTEELLDTLDKFTSLGSVFDENGAQQKRYSGKLD